MTNATARNILRVIHIILAIPILGYIYGPIDQVAQYAPKVRFVFFPAIVLTGLLMWKGHLLRRLVSKKSAKPDINV